MKKLLPLIVACCLPTGILASPLLGTWQADATALLTLGCTDFCPEQVTMTATFSEDSQYTLDILFDYEGDLWASLTEDGTDLSALGLPAMELRDPRRRHLRGQRLDLRRHRVRTPGARQPGRSSGVLHEGRPHPRPRPGRRGQP